MIIIRKMNTIEKRGQLFENSRYNRVGLLNDQVFIDSLIDSINLNKNELINTYYCNLTKNEPNFIFEVELRQNVKLKCFNLNNITNVIWLRQKFENQSNKTMIASSLNVDCRQKFFVDRAGNLNINDFDYDDVGTYSCLDGDELDSLLNKSRFEKNFFTNQIFSFNGLNCSRVLFEKKQLLFDSISDSNETSKEQSVYNMMFKLNYQLLIPQATSDVIVFDNDFDASELVNSDDLDAETLFTNGFLITDVAVNYTESQFIFQTLWQEWSECQQCDEVSVRTRIGECFVTYKPQMIKSLNVQLSDLMTYMSPLGLPCNLNIHLNFVHTNISHLYSRLVHYEICNIECDESKYNESIHVVHLI